MVNAMATMVGDVLYIPKMGQANQSLSDLDVFHCFPWHSIPCHLNLDCSKNFPNSPRHPLAAISNLPFEGLAHRAGKQRSRLSGVLVTPVFRIPMTMMAKKHRHLNHSLD